MLKIGDWVTQYRKGFWQIVDIKPKYAEEDRVFENGKHQKKGDLIGSWILMKKGFTPKMKFRLDFDQCDSFWCKEVSSTTASAIEQYFKYHPDEYQIFSNTPFIDHPAVCTVWVNLTPEEEVLFRNILRVFPSRFTQEYVMQVLEEQGLKGCFSKPPANFTFVCWHTLWELDDDFNPLYKNPELSPFITTTE